MKSVRGSNTAKGCGCAFAAALILFIGGFWWVIDQSFGPSSAEVESDVRKLERDAEKAGFPELVFEATGAGTYASITYRLSDQQMDLQRYTELCTYLRDELGGGRNGSVFHAEGVRTRHEGTMINGCPHQAFANLAALNDADLENIVGIDFTQSSTMPIVAWASIMTSSCDVGEDDCAQEMGERAAKMLAVLMDGQDASAAGEGDDRPRVQIQSKVSPSMASSAELLNDDRKGNLYATVTVAGETGDLADSSTIAPIVGDLMAQNHRDIAEERESGASGKDNPRNINETAMRVDASTKEMQLAGVSLTSDVQRQHACGRRIPMDRVYDDIASRHGWTNGLDTLRELCGKGTS